MSPWYVVGGAVVAAVVGYLLVRRARVGAGSGSKLPAGGLPPGWQFYSNPTALEPPGTVFRIDPEGRRYLVDSLKVAIRRGDEAAGKVEESVDADAGVVARFLGLHGFEAGMAARRTERFSYEITDPVREVVVDVDLEKALPGLLEALDLKRGHRYFVIREAREARAIRYRLTRKQVESFGGEAAVGKQVSAKGKVFSSDRSGQYVLEQEFKDPLRVMFLPEEIRQVTSALAGERPKMGLLPVKEPLHWKDSPPVLEA